jgi:enoyl-[acyl-carrier-protein] reductase (NADH)
VPAVAGRGPHGMSAAAIDELTQVLARDLRERDITVNGVSLDADKSYTSGRATDVIVYLLSDAGHGISGQVIHVDDRQR